MWSGVGLAFAYAGSADLDQSIEIPLAAGEHLLHLAQGVTFAAEARELGGIPLIIQSVPANWCAG